LSGEVLMTSHSEAYQAVLEEVCDRTIGPAATEVDTGGRFPSPTCAIFIGKAACGMGLF
jgi:hypothetical protein